MPRNNPNKYRNGQDKYLGLDSYGMLKCKIIDYKEERSDNRTPHFQIHAQSKKLVTIGLQ